MALRTPAHPCGGPSAVVVSALTCAAPPVRRPVRLRSGSPCQRPIRGPAAAVGSFLCSAPSPSHRRPPRRGPLSSAGSSWKLAAASLACWPRSGSVGPGEGPTKSVIFLGSQGPACQLGCRSRPHPPGTLEDLSCRRNGRGRGSTVGLEVSGR